MADDLATRVNLDDIDASRVEEQVILNPDANPMEAPPPVDDGTWRVKLVGADDWTPGETKKNKNGETREYLKTKFSGIVIAEGTPNNNKRVFVNVNTLSFDGKSEMAYILLQILGGKNNPQARQAIEGIKTYVDLARAFRTAIAGEPIIKVKTKWTARYNAGTREEPDYKCHISGQASFPSNGSGGRLNIVSVKGAGDVSAQAEVTEYFPDGN